MSSDFYQPNLSRNLVSAGAFGYRENVALCLLARDTEETTRERKCLSRRIVNFVVFPKLGLEGESVKRKAGSDASHLRLMVASLENHPLAGRLVLDPRTA